MGPESSLARLPWSRTMFRSCRASHWAARVKIRGPSPQDPPRRTAFVRRQGAGQYRDRDIARVGAGSVVLKSIRPAARPSACRQGWSVAPGPAGRRRRWISSSTSRTTKFSSFPRRHLTTSSGACELKGRAADALRIPIVTRSEILRLEKYLRSLFSTGHHHHS